MRPAEVRSQAVLDFAAHRLIELLPLPHRSFTGATDAAAVVVAMVGALTAGATFGFTEVPLDNDGPLANDGAGAEKVDATGVAGPLCKPSRD